MKKRLFLLLSLTLITTSCGFVKYVDSSPVSYDESFVATKNSYLAQIDNIGDENDYYEKEKKQYYSIIQEAKSKIEESNSEEEWISIVDNTILKVDGLKTILSYQKDDAISYIKQYVDLSHYREQEQEVISGKIEKYEKLIMADNNASNFEKYKSEFIDKISELKTDNEYYELELNALIEKKKSDYNSYLDTRYYRENEVALYSAYRNTFNTLIDKLETKDEVEDLYKEYIQFAELLKTDYQLYVEEANKHKSNLFNELKIFVNYESLNEEQKHYYDSVRTIILDLPIWKAEKKIIEEKISYINEEAMLEEENALLTLKSLYLQLLKYLFTYEQYINLSSEAIGYYFNSVSLSIISSTTYSDIVASFNSVKTAIEDYIDDGDYLDNLEVVVKAKNIYGDNLLDAPASYEVNTKLELGKILEFYTFYRDNSYSLLDNSFYVKVNIDFDNEFDLLDELINNYCELAKYTVNIDVKQREEGLLFIIDGLPFANDVDEKEPLISKKESLVNYQSTSHETREDTFNDFNYYLYPKHLSNVWNSEQLWYALEHGYIPDCVEGSPAETVLNQAKTVLRTIIKNDMTDEEKIFSIFDWFSKNVWFNFAGGTMHSTQNYAEGPLLYNRSICRGYAKAYIIMLRIEGIEAYLSFTPTSEHEFVLVNIGGEYYVSDVTHSYQGNLLSYRTLLLVNQVDNKIWAHLPFGSDDSFIYDNITELGHSIYCDTVEEANAILDEYRNSGEKETISLIFKNFSYKDIDLSSLNITIMNNFGYEVNEIEVVVNA